MGSRCPNSSLAVSPLAVEKTKYFQLCLCFIKIPFKRTFTISHPRQRIAYYVDNCHRHLVSLFSVSKNNCKIVCFFFFVLFFFFFFLFLFF